MSIIIENKALLPIRRDKQISSSNTSSGGGSVIGTSEGGSTPMSASDILSRLLTVDGTGSGLDADLLDGQHASVFATLTGVETLTNKTLTSPKVNENVVLTTTATKLNYLTSAVGTTGTTSTNIVFSTSPTLTSPKLNENVELTSTSTKLNYLTSATGTTGTNTTNVVYSESPTFTGTLSAAIMHATTLLIDHIGEHTASHTVVFDNTVNLPASTLVPGDGTIGQAAGPLLTFDDTNNYLEITGCNTGFGTATPLSKVAINGGLHVGGDSDAGNDNLLVDGIVTISSTLNTAITNSGGLLKDNYVSQLTGYRISNDGQADFRYLYVDELHAKSFITDLEQALAGGQIITKSVAKVAADFTLPGAGSTGTLIVEEFAGFTGAVFVDGDVIRLRQFSRANNTTVDIANAWGTVVYVSRDTTANPTTQSYTFTRSAAPNTGTATGTIKTGTLALDYGTAGQGLIETTTIDGLNGANSPYSQILTWTGHPATGSVVKMRSGNLAGITDSDFGALSGYGDYLTNIYAKGSVVLPSAGISSVGTTDASIRFWAGSSYADRATAPFRVTQNGELTATGALELGTKTVSYSGEYYNLGLKGCDIWENAFNGDDSQVYINRIGYQGGLTKYRTTVIGDGKNNLLALFRNADIHLYKDTYVTGNFTSSGLTVASGHGRIDGNLSVGIALAIGKTSPTKALDVVGDIIATGNVGIGTTTPYWQQTLVQSVSDGAGGVYGGKIVLSRYISSQTNSRSSAIFHHYDGSTTDKLVFAIENAGATDVATLANAKMVITNTGNVGIGTTTPSSKLHVVGDGLFTGGVTVNANGVAISNESSGSVGAIGHRGADTSTMGSLSFYLAKSDGSSGITPLSLSGSAGGIGSAAATINGVWPLRLPDFATYSTGTTMVWGVGGNVYLLTSSRKFKDDIVEHWSPEPDILDKFLHTDPVQFKYKDTTEDLVGFLAEDMDFPNMLNYDKDGKPFSLREHSIMAYQHLILQKHDEEIIELKKKIEELTLLIANKSS